MVDLLGTEPKYSEPGTAQYYMELWMRHHNQVNIAMVTGPIYTARQIHGGADPKQVAAHTALGSLQAWLFYKAIGYKGTLLEGVAAKHIAKKELLQVTGGAGIIVGVAGASVIGGKTYVGTMEGFAPEDPAQRSSFMNSVAAGMAGAFGGMTYE